MNPIPKMFSVSIPVIALLFSMPACSNSSTINSEQDAPTYTATEKLAQDASNKALSQSKPEFTTQAIARFDEPWAMVALPQTMDEPTKLLVTQKTGELFIVDTATGSKKQLSGIPKVAYGGQGGLGDIIVAPDFATTNTVYLSYVAAGAGSDKNKFGAKVIKAKLTGLNSDAPSLQAITPIWEQRPKVSGQGHYSHRLLFSPDGRHLYISSGDRQKKDPAQDMSVNLGKVIRLNPDGSVPNDNPFANTTNATQDNAIAAQFWSIGHRNILGMTFDDSGRLWAHEMGPRGGDEFNLIKKGNNYGWPLVSNGRNYSGVDIPDHDTRPEFTAPKITWTPVISPSSMSIYKPGSHNDFPAWQNQALLSGLSSKALIVVQLDHTEPLEGTNSDADNAADSAADSAVNSAAERYRYEMGARIRSVLSVEGRVYLLEDGDGAHLWRLLPQ